MISENTTADIAIDFRNDWGNILRQKLTEDGYSLASDLDVDSICLQYFNTLKRRLEPCPRKVLKARQFICPPEHIEAINIIFTKAETGRSLIPHLNKIHSPKKADSLLDSWGIYHFHLGTSVTDSGHAERTRSLLFARVTNSHFYMLDIFDHNSWHEKRLIEIIHDNWRESIDVYRLPKGYKTTWVASTESEIKSLRKSNINTVLQVCDGTLYMPLGGGQALNGFGVDIRVACNSYHRTIQNLENHVKENLDTFRNIANEHDLELPEKPQFQLQLIDGVAYAVEINAEIAYQLIELPLRI
jgi:hypothetical protein